jgi:hypothetical protein
MLAWSPELLGAATALVSKVVITTDIQSIDVDTLSGAITVQTQNAGGTEEKLDSTADVTFVSSSGTGEFLGGTGKVVTKTMNSGSANKTFYYKDSTAGKVTLTITVTPRSGVGEWVVQHVIYIGTTPDQGNVDESSDNTNPDDNQTTDDGNTTTDDTSGSNTTDSGSGSSSMSSHSSSKKLSTYNKKESLKVGAGRNRVVLVNTPVYFEAETNQVSKKVRPRLDYTWSFGDGDSDDGALVDHVYYFPGEYNVILTARDNDEVSVTRTKVKVIDNLLTINNVVAGEHGYVEIKNPSNSEVNINGWEIVADERSYVISIDTIINAKSSIRIPNKVLHFDPVSNEVSLLFPTDDLAYIYRATNANYNIQQHEVVAQSERQVGHIESVEQEIPVLEVSATTTNYATTVRAVAATPKRSGWWSFVTSLFSVE